VRSGGFERAESDTGEFVIPGMALATAGSLDEAMITLEDGCRFHTPVPVRLHEARGEGPSLELRITVTDGQCPRGGWVSASDLQPLSVVPGDVEGARRIQGQLIERTELQMSQHELTRTCHAVAAEHDVRDLERWAQSCIDACAGAASREAIYDCAVARVRTEPGVPALGEAFR
jgi:hypothetical protein